MMHANVSQPPVVIATCGMSPSDCFFGKRVVCSTPLTTLVNTFVWQLLTFATVTCRRHLPTCMTSGMFDPLGAPLMEKCPFESVSATAIGFPDAIVPHLSHVTPAVSGSSGA